GYVTPYWDWRLTAQSKADPSAVVEGNGVLQLLTFLTDPNGPATQSNTTTGQIWTRDTFTQQYGWFEFRCKMAPGAGMDEACWLLSDGPDSTEYQEIDMPEWLGNRPNTLYFAHWYVPPGGNWSGTMVSPTGPDWSADFHTYAINWQPGSITYYVDGNQVWQTTDNVPQEPMMLILTSGSSSLWGGDINASTCPNAMVLDYVRVYQGGGTTPPNPPPPPPSSGALIGDPNYTQQTQGDGNPLIAPWSGTGPAMIGLDGNNGNGPSPTPCGFIFSPVGTGWSAITQTGTLSANTAYTVSAMIQTSSPFPGGTIGVQTPGGTVLAQQAFGEQDGYAQVSVSFNSGSATTLSIFAGFTNNSGSYAWIHVDNWKLTTGTAPPPASGGNLVQDPAYENQTAPGGGPLVAPWDTFGPAMVGVDDQNGMNGSKCGYIYDNGTGAWTDIKQWVTVTPNTTYTLSCFVQTDSSFAAQGCFGAQAADGTDLGWKSYGQMTNYTQLTVTFNSGSHTSIFVYAGFTDQGPGAWIHVDNWTMK
ncbi:MAG TPA: glycoside hydrolase family 16 protein, partial [Planctomycetota bacterium]|nr:glycoside hydrolase family 16 protein [Planctomycetota bacterium]